MVSATIYVFTQIVCVCLVGLQAGGRGEAARQRAAATERRCVHGHHLPGVHPDAGAQAERGRRGGGDGH